MPQGRVESHGTEGLFDEVLDRGFVLLVDGRTGASLDASTTETTARLGVAVHHLTDRRLTTQGVADTGGVYGRWFDETGRAAVLWRPDFYILGTTGVLWTSRHFSPHLPQQSSRCRLLPQLEKGSGHDHTVRRPSAGPQSVRDHVHADRRLGRRIP